MLRVTKKISGILSDVEKRRTVILGFMMLLGGIMESVSISFVLPMIQAIMNEEKWSTTWYAKVICEHFHIDTQRQYVIVLLMILISVFFFKGVYLLFEYYIQYTFIARCRYHIQSKLMQSYLRKPYTFFLYSNSGEIIRIINDDTLRLADLFESVLTFYTEGIIAVMLVMTVFVISPDIAIGTLMIVLIEILVIARIIKPVLEKSGNRYMQELSLANKWILQGIQGIKSIKVSGREHFFVEKYDKHAKNVVDEFGKHRTLSSVPRVIIESLTVVAFLIILLIMMVMGTDLKDIIPELSAIIVAMVRILPSSNRISASLNSIPYFEGALDNIIQVVCEKEWTEEDGKEEPISRISFCQEAGLQSVTYAYPNTDKRILDDASIAITPGLSVGIVGMSGSGKTTMVDILLGLLKPQKGVVYSDGLNIEENMKGWLSNLAYVPQTIFLMDDTIRENVAFGRHMSEIDDEQVWKALKDANLDEFVRSLPDGLDTMVGEAGIRLSGGQRQRIGIARALYRNPNLIIFDEATSALDNETEAEIMEAIHALHGHKTIIIIAHRLSTIEGCDVVYRVEDGKIVRDK